MKQYEIYIYIYTHTLYLLQDLIIGLLSVSFALLLHMCLNQFGLSNNSLLKDMFLENFFKLRYLVHVVIYLNLHNQFTCGYKPPTYPLHFKFPPHVLLTPPLFSVTRRIKFGLLWSRDWKIQFLFYFQQIQEYYCTRNDTLKILNPALTFR